MESNKNQFFLLFRQTGTGKTTTVVEILLQLLANLPKSRILIATQSNNAADVLLERLVASGFIAATDLIRIVSYNHARHLSVDDGLKPYYATIASDHDDGMDLVRWRSCTMPDLIAYRVVVTTTLTAGNFLEWSCMMHYFTHALVDEAGQCSEMEAAIPMALIGPQGKLVLVSESGPICATLFLGARLFFY